MATGYGGTGAAGTGTGVRATASRYALLPLRIFLGVTFLYAGLDKLTDPVFFSNATYGSLTATLHAVRGSAAFPGMIDLALKSPDGFGYAIAFGEIAVGLGALVGLLTRLAAFGGVLISLSLWLTISWATQPYYYGNDLVYLIAWLPLLLAGAPNLSFDALIGRRRGHGVSTIASGGQAVRV
jgi:thiosulfate dehydrogenase (quinone) large subunit